MLMIRQWSACPAPELLAVSARLFAKGGFEATSMRDIAGEAGMLAGSMYYHFPSKNDLIAAVYAGGRGRDRRRRSMRRSPARGPWARLEAACVGPSRIAAGRLAPMPR